MGACSSCLSGRESHDSESARLLDDDIYQSGYNYGTTQGQIQGADLEGVKREREALEAICQKASDSVVDIWAVQSHPFMPVTPPMRSHNTSAATSRVPSSEATVTQARLASSQTPIQGASPDQPRRSVSPIPGEFGGMKYLACRNVEYPNKVDLSALPKHWGEVVMPRRKGEKPPPDSNTSQPRDDIFGVLVVK